MFGVGVPEGIEAGLRRIWRRLLAGLRPISQAAQVHVRGDSIHDELFFVRGGAGQNLDANVVYTIFAQDVDVEPCFLQVAAGADLAGEGGGAGYGRNCIHLKLIAFNLVKLAVSFRLPQAIQARCWRVGGSLSWHRRC